MATSKRVTFDDVKREILRMEPKIKPGDPTFTAPAVLLSACFVGSRLGKVLAFTGLPRKEVKPKWDGFVKNGIFKNGKVCGEDYSDPKTGGIGFWCDVLCGEGRLKRASATK